MRKSTVVVVEDEEDIFEVVRYNLEKEGFHVHGAFSGEIAQKKITAHQPDLVLLDLMLPGISGLDLCRKLKQQDDTRQIPIIMVTAKTEDSDIVAGLELGAEDYITKPFSPRVLIARVRSVLRRQKIGVIDESNIINFDGILINPGQHKVSINDTRLDLTPSEFRILHFLARRPGWVYTRDQIIDAVRGEGYAITDRAIDVQVVGLRKKMGEFGAWIETVRGIGYRFREKE